MSFVLTPASGVVVCAVANGGGNRGRESSPRRVAPGRMTPSAPTPPGQDERAVVDARLLQRVAARDQDAFAQLYDRFSNPLYAIALRVVSDSAEAQDIVHDVFVTLWEKAGAFDLARGSAFSWAVTLVRNRAIDRVRMRRRRAELLADSAPDDFGHAETGGGLAADATAIAGEDARAVRAAVASLPSEQQRALELAFFSGLTQEQIAEKLQQPLGTVKARIRRGLLKLRDSLAPRS